MISGSHRARPRSRHSVSGHGYHGNFTNHILEQEWGGGSKIPQGILGKEDPEMVFTHDR